MNRETYEWLCEQAADPYIPHVHGDLDEPEPTTPEQPRTDELKPGDRLVEWKHMAQFTVTAIDPLPDHLWYGERRTDGTYPSVSGMRVTGRTDDGETVHYDAAISRRWSRDETPRTEPEPLTPEQLAEIRERLAAATRGPWGIYRDSAGRNDIGADLVENSTGYQLRRGIAQLDPEPIDNDLAHKEWDEDDDQEQVDADAEFIAHSPTDVAALLAEVTRLRTELAGVLAVCDRAEQQATRWENPLSVPEWVTEIRDAAGVGEDR